MQKQWGNIKLSPASVASHKNGKEWEKYLKHGVRCKNLRYDTPMYAAKIISQARNKPHEGVCLNHEWSTMRILSKMVRDAGSAICLKAMYEHSMQKASEIVGRDVADSPMGRQLMELVHKFGPHTKFVAELVAWGEKLINS